MARYTVNVKIKHDHLGDGPSDLVVTMHGDKNILQDVENYALHYEEMSKSLATVEAELARYKDGVRCPNCDTLTLKLGAAEAERDQAIREIGRIGRELGTCQYERDRLKAENERLLRCLADYPAGNQTEPDVKAALREVDGGKD